MASKRILITGGAGFIGSHLSDELLARGYAVRALDCLSPQVHGPARTRPGYLAAEIELHVGDVRDREAVRRALRGVDAVFHFAAAVGVGQSMYQLEQYTSVNNLVVGNLGPQLDCGDGGITFSHNVFQGVACGPTDSDVANLGFVDLFGFDLHVLGTSPAIDAGDPANFPATDIDGQRRPSSGSSAPDAGADEIP